MGIRGFIRNTVEAIRRFFNGQEIEDDLNHTPDSILHSDEMLAETVAGEIAAEEFFIDPVVPARVASELVAGELSVDELLADELSAGAMSDDDISSGEWKDDRLAEDVVEILLEESQHQPVATIVELDITSHSDDREDEYHAVKPVHQRVSTVVELEVLNYPVDTEEEIAAYLNEIISSEDLAYPLEEQEIEGTPVHIQNSGEEMTLTSALESLLFVAESPVDAAHLAKILTLPTEQVIEALQKLDRSYATTCRGLRIQNYEEKFQLVTAPSAASMVEDFLSFKLSTKLSGPALEALAIIAYSQPVTRAQIEAVRGVDCASVLRSLIQLGLVEESGRLETLGRPILYRVTPFFMQHFGLMKMNELPPLALEEKDLLVSTIESRES